MTLTESYWPKDDSEPIVEITVGDLLREAAAAAPERTALVAGVPDPAARRRWSYAQLLAEAEETAGALLGRFEPGERVAIWAFLDELPLTPSGKIQKFVLRDRFTAGEI